MPPLRSNSSGRGVCWCGGDAQGSRSSSFAVDDRYVELRHKGPDLEGKDEDEDKDEDEEEEDGRCVIGTSKERSYATALLTAAIALAPLLLLSAKLYSA